MFMFAMASRFLSVIHLARQSPVCAHHSLILVHWQSARPVLRLVEVVLR